jgi:hypothetical protein
MLRNGKYLKSDIAHFLLKVIGVNAKKVYGDIALQFHTFFIPALDKSEWSPSHPGCFTLGK